MLIAGKLEGPGHFPGPGVKLLDLGRHRRPLQFRNGRAQIQRASFPVLRVVERRFILITQAEVQGQILGNLPVVIKVQAVETSLDLRRDVDREARSPAVPVVPIATPLCDFGRGEGPQKERGIGVAREQEVRIVVG